MCANPSNTEPDNSCPVQADEARPDFDSERRMWFHLHWEDRVRFQNAEQQRDHFFQEAGLLHHALSKVEQILWDQAKYEGADSLIKKAWKAANDALYDAEKRTIKKAS